MKKSNILATIISSATACTPEQNRVGRFGLTKEEEVQVLMLFLEYYGDGSKETFSSAANKVANELGEEESPAQSHDFGFRQDSGNVPVEVPVHSIMTGSTSVEVYKVKNTILT